MCFKKKKKKVYFFYYSGERSIAAEGISHLHKYLIANSIEKKITGFSGGLELICSQTPPQDNNTVVRFSGN